jgi:hypothetical protein
MELITDYSSFSALSAMRGEISEFRMEVQWTKY